MLKVIETTIYHAVAAMKSVVNVTSLQRPGGKRLAVAEFLRGFDLQPGMVFDPPNSVTSSPSLV